MEEGECVRSCVGVADGLYQACDSCYEYVECDQGNVVEHSCDGDDMFDDSTNACEEDSSTCDGSTRSCVCTSNYMELYLNEILFRVQISVTSTSPRANSAAV